MSRDGREVGGYPPPHTHTLTSRICRCLWLLLLCLQDEGPAEEAEMDDETWAKNVTAGGAAAACCLLACLPWIPLSPAVPTLLQGATLALLFWIRVVSPCQLSHEAKAGWRTPATQSATSHPCVHVIYYLKTEPRNPLCVPTLPPSLCVTASLCDCLSV